MHLEVAWVDIDVSHAVLSSFGMTSVTPERISLTGNEEENKYSWRAQGKL